MPETPVSSHYALQELQQFLVFFYKWFLSIEVLKNKHKKYIKNCLALVGVNADMNLLVYEWKYE